MVWLHFHKMSRIGRSVETESRLKFSRGCDSLMGAGFSTEVMNYFGGRWRLCLYNILNIQSATELYALEWLLLCDISVTTHTQNDETNHPCSRHHRWKANSFCFLHAIWLGLIVLVNHLKWLPFRCAYSQQRALSGFTCDTGVKRLKLS